MAAALAAQHDSEVTLLHVIEAISGVTVEEEGQFYGRLEEASWKRLKQVGTRLTRLNVRWKAMVLFGKRGKVILDVARKLKADLIVMTAPRIQRSQLGVGLASLSFKVSVFSPCPILLVK